MKLSICIPTYNRPEQLPNCLESIYLAKKRANLRFNVCISDNNSNYDIKKIIDEYKKKLDITFNSNKRNIGLPKSLNKAIMLSKGRYVTRVDSDDYVQRNFLFLSKLFLDMNREYQAVAVDYIKVDNFETVLSKENCLKNEIACGIMYRKECLINIGLYNEKFKNK